MEEGAAATVAEIEIVLIVLMREFDSGDEGFERRVVVEEGGEIIGAVADIGAESED